MPRPTPDEYTQEAREAYNAYMREYQRNHK